MSRPMTVQDSVVIAADAHALWSQVADPSQMGRWSPENTGATITTRGTAAPVGTTFVGTNRRGLFRWSTECEVTVSDAGRRFAFDVLAIRARTPWWRLPIAGWAYDFEPTEGGTRVTETWTDHRRGWPDWAAACFDRVATGASCSRSTSAATSRGRWRSSRRSSRPEPRPPPRRARLRRR